MSTESAPYLIKRRKKSHQKKIKTKISVPTRMKISTTHSSLKDTE